MSLDIVYQTNMSTELPFKELKDPNQKQIPFFDTLSNEKKTPVVPTTPVVQTDTGVLNQLYRILNAPPTPPVETQVASPLPPTNNTKVADTPLFGATNPVSLPAASASTLSAFPQGVNTQEGLKGVEEAAAAEGSSNGGKSKKKKGGKSNKKKFSKKRKGGKRAKSQKKRR
jgi:hypothetical protein